MSNAELMTSLKQMLGDGRDEAEIRAELGPRLAPGCKLTVVADTQFCPPGQMRRCGRIEGCDDPADNTDWSCGDCYEA